METIRTTAQIIDAYASELKAADNKMWRIMSDVDVELAGIRAYMERLRYLLSVLTEDFFNEHKDAKDILSEFDESRILCGLAQSCAMDITESLDNATSAVKGYFTERRAKAE